MDRQEGKFALGGNIIPLTKVLGAEIFLNHDEMNHWRGDQRQRNVEGT